MPNLAGILNMGAGTIDLQASIARLVRVLGVEGIDYAIRSYQDRDFCAVNLLNGICGNLEQPATNGQSLVLFLDGEIVNLGEVWRGAGDAEDSLTMPAPAAVCLTLFERHGEDFVKMLNGQFNIVIYDRSARTVRVFNDRLAYRPFYYRCVDGVAMFGLEIKSILAALERAIPFEPRGILEFFTFGHNLDDRTLFSDVRVLPPGSILELKSGRAHIRRYWRPVYGRSTHASSLDDAARQLGVLLCQATRRRADSARKYGIFLSGGLDSRAAGGALARVRNDVASFTFGDEDSCDLVYGQRLAAQLGFKRHRLSYKDVSLTEFLPRVVWRSEGSIPFHLTLSIAHHSRIRREAEVIFNGHFGDALSGGHLLPSLFAVRNNRELARHILRKRTQLRLASLQPLFKRAFLDGVYPEMVQGIEESLLEMGEDRLPLTYNLWDMVVRQTRSTFCSSAVDRYLLEPVTPFTDNDLLDWMLCQPIHWLFGQRLYKRMVVRTFPEIANVPWARTGRRVTTNFVVDMAVLASLFAAKRLKRMTAMPRTSIVAPRLRTSAKYREVRVPVDLLPGDVFERAAVPEIISSTLGGRQSATLLYLLLTFTECARLFGSGNVTEQPVESRPVLSTAILRNA
jgi:asparagine synthase (glutamine-hydrolysing)